MMAVMIPEFSAPQYFILLAVIPLYLAYYFFRLKRKQPTIRISTVRGLECHGRTLRYYLRWVPAFLRAAALILIVCALARPRTVELSSSSQTEGVDIILSIDISGSMLARDFTPDRMTAAKETAANFITDRVNDRIGLVVFAGESFTQCPLTTDKRSLLNLLNGIRSGMIEDGTAIGNGLATAVNRLRESEAKSKVIILLTDGVNNSGQIAPLTAAEIAKSFGIRVYTVGIGTTGTAPTPAVDMWGRLVFVQAPVEIDEEVLTDIANMTGGEYFRATDNNSLKGIYEKINQLEKSIIETSEYTRYNELFGKFLLWAVILLVTEFIFRYFILKRIP